MQKSFYKKASLTIEMTLLMPVIISVIIFIMFEGFYIHDRCVIEQYMFGKIDELRIISEETGNAEITDQTGIISKQNEISDVSDIYDMLIGKWNIDIEAVTDEDRITVYVKGEMKLSDGLVSKYFLGNMFTVNTETSVYSVGGPKYVREEYEYPD